jgi:Fe-S oxidoreductase
LPAVRDQDAATLVAAAGTSCRHQIEHGAERSPLHPAQILNAARLK